MALLTDEELNEIELLTKSGNAIPVDRITMPAQTLMNMLDHSRQLTRDLEAARARIKMLEDAYVKHVYDLAEAKAAIETILEFTELQKREMQATIEAQCNEAALRDHIDNTWCLCNFDYTKDHRLDCEHAKAREALAAKA